MWCLCSCALPAVSTYLCVCLVYWCIVSFNARTENLSKMVGEHKHPSIPSQQWWAGIQTPCNQCPQRVPLSLGFAPMSHNFTWLLWQAVTLVSWVSLLSMWLPCKKPKHNYSQLQVAKLKHQLCWLIWGKPPKANSSIHNATQNPQLLAPNSIDHIDT